MSEPDDETFIDDDVIQQALKTLTPLVPRTHTVYDTAIRKNPELFEKIFQILRQKRRLPHRTLTKISSKTNIPENTLKSWRRQLKEDPKWRPKHGSPGQPRLLTVEQEAVLRKRIVDDYVRQQRLLTRDQCQSMAYKVWLDAARKHLEESAQVPNELPSGEELRIEHEPDEAIVFTAENRPAFSDHWQVRFEKRAGLSYRVPHLKRRSDPRDDYVARFVEEFEVARLQFTPDSILNADETCWRIVNGQLKTIGLKGSEEVTVETTFNTKDCITVMACCTSDGQKLPLMIIAEGTTAACEAKFRNDKKLRTYMKRTLFVDHTPNGWSTCEFAKRYLDFVSDQVKGRNIYLIWDLHSSHRKDSVIDYAKERNIHLSFVPAGQTSYWQPLDKKVFGGLKRKAQKYFTETLDGGRYTINDAILTLVRAWESMKEEKIRSAWDHL